MLKNAAEIPTTILSWLNDTSWPRTAAGAISAMYIGAMIRAAPTPRPPIRREITSVAKFGANADIRAETANSTAASRSTGRRPSRSLKGPEHIIANEAVSVSEATAQPSSIWLRENSGLMKETTPEITEASKPIRNPPSATISAVLTMKRMSAITASGATRYGAVTSFARVLWLLLVATDCRVR